MFQRFIVSSSSSSSSWGRMEACVKFIFFACGFCGALCLTCIHMECSYFPGHISPTSGTPLCCFLPQSAGHMWLECICGIVALPGGLLLWIYIFSFKVWCGSSLYWFVFLRCWKSWICVLQMIQIGMELGTSVDEFCCIFLISRFRNGNFFFPSVD